MKLQRIIKAQRPLQIPLPELNSHTLFIGSCLVNLDLRKSLPFMVVFEGLECCHSHF